MSFIEKIKTEMYDAMKSSEKDKAGTLRTLLAKLKDKEINTRKELSEQDGLAVIKTLVKQRKESVAMYEKANRPELADKEKNGRYPQKLFSRILESSSFKLNWVLDPFMKTGDVGLASKLGGRRFIGFETNKDHLLLAMKRIDGN